QARASIRISPDSTSVTFSRPAWGTTVLAGVTARLAPETSQTSPDLLGAAGLWKLLKDAPVSLDRVGLLPCELLCTTEVREERLVIEIARPEPGERGTVGVEGLGRVVLRLPRVADRRLGQRTQRAGGSARERDLIRGARRRVLAGVVAEVAQVVGRLGSGARGRMARQDGPEAAHGPGARLRGGLRSLRGGDANHDLGVRRHDPTLFPGV